MIRAGPPPPLVRYGEPAGRWVLVATVLGSGLAFIDATVVNVALPRIGTSLGADAAGLQWTVNGYTLSLTSLILLGGSLGDRFGRRRIFVVGVCWFAVASALCGLAPSVGTLIAARVLQGVGGALLTPGALAILEASFRTEDRARAIGAWSGLGGIAGALGPFLGGWIVEVASWRLVFLVNLPLAALVVAVALRHVPETRDPAAPRRVDVVGVLTGALGLGGLSYGFTAWPALGARSPAVIAALGVGVLATLGFLLAERRSAHPMLPLSVFASRTFTAVNLVTFAVYAALGGAFFLVVLNLQVVAGFSPLAAGSAMLPITGITLLLSARAGALAQRIGPGVPMTVGPILCAGAMVLLARVGVGASYALDVLPAVILLGLGLALTVAPLTTVALGALDDRHAGIASGVNNAVARAAGLFAVAVLPLAAGIGSGRLTDAAALAPTHRVAMLLCAGAFLGGAALAFLMIAKGGRRPAPAPAPSARGEDRGRFHCPVTGPPLYPSHAGAAPRPEGAARAATGGSTGPADEREAGTAGEGELMSAISRREQQEIARANQSGLEAVVFVHGLWLLASSWEPWRELFEESGYVTLAPSWPDDPETVDEARRHPEVFAHKRVEQVTDHFADVIQQLESPPAVIGHSFGGLIAQRLAGQGIASACVAIDPAPFRGVLPLPFSALRSAFPVLGNPANYGRAVALTFEQFRYGWANALSEAEARRLYETYSVAGPGAPLFQAATANLNPWTAAKVDTTNPDRGPLLVISGEKDHTVPGAIARATYHRQRRNPGVTSFRSIPDRGHSLTIDAGWREVAEVALAFVRLHQPASPARASADRERWRGGEGHAEEPRP